MKTQEHTAGPTAGAKRAAHFIYYEWPTARPEAELAEYIDRETGHSQLLEALEQVRDLAKVALTASALSASMQFGAHLSEIRDVANDAIKSAKGETL